MKFLQEDEVRNGVSTPRGARDIQATDAHVTNRVNSVLSRKLPVEAPDGGGEIVVNAGKLLTLIEHEFYFLEEDFTFCARLRRDFPAAPNGFKFGKVNTASGLRKVR